MTQCLDAVMATTKCSDQRSSDADADAHWLHDLMTQQFHGSGNRRCNDSVIHGHDARNSLIQ